MQGNNEIKERIYRLLEGSEFIRSMELELVKLDEFEAIGRIPFKKSFLNSYGSMHGGFLYSLADTVAGSLACMCGDYVTTVDGSMNYFEPAVSEEFIYCYAYIVRTGRHLVNVKAEIKDDNGKLLDNASFNYYRIKKK